MTAMKRANVKSVSSTDGKAPVAPFTPRGGVSKNRILLAYAEDRIDFAAMDPEASKKLNELLHKPEVQAQFGIGSLSDRFDPAHCKRIYQALGKTFESLASMVLRWPKSASEKLLYTEQEQEELSEPTAKVLDEFGGTWLKEHQSLMALIVVFSAITQAKAQDAILEIKRVQSMQRVTKVPTTIPASRSDSGGATVAQ